MDTIQASKIAMTNLIESQYENISTQIGKLRLVAMSDDFFSSGARERADIQFDVLEKRYEKKLADVVLATGEAVDSDIIKSVKGRLSLIEGEMDPARKHARTVMTPVLFILLIGAVLSFLGLRLLPSDVLTPGIGALLALFVLMLPLWAVGSFVGGIFIRKSFNQRLDAVLSSVEELAVVTSRSPTLPSTKA